MTTPALRQQDQAVEKIVACVPGQWLRIAVNYEYMETGDQCVDSMVALYLIRQGQDIEAVDLRLPREVLGELVILRDLLPNPQNQKWSTCDLVVEDTGKYKFNFSYEPPKRLNGILDEESYERFGNYADSYKAELERKT